MKLPVKYHEIPPYEKRIVREEYIRIQKGMCWYCKAPLKDAPPEGILGKKVTPHIYPEGFFTHPVHLHHDHITEMTVGAVHNYCNAVLWEYEGK